MIQLKNLTTIFILGTSLWYLGSCSKDQGPIFLPPPIIDTVEVQISFQDSIQPILDLYCILCHPDNANLNLLNGNSWTELVNVPSFMYSPSIRVIPYDTLNSVLWNKIIDNGSFGIVMPPMNNLPENDKALIKKWILQGAPNN